MHWAIPNEVIFDYCMTEYVASHLRSGGSDSGVAFFNLVGMHVFVTGEP